MRARKLLRRIALLLIAALCLGQASLALAACSMERGGLAATWASADEPCGGCGLPAEGAASANACVAHCTSDLQLTGVAPVLARSAADAPVLVLDHPALRLHLHHGLAAAPPGTPPRRILLHSFLI